MLQRQGRHLLEGLLCSRILIHIWVEFPGLLPAMTCDAFLPVMTSMLSSSLSRCTQCLMRTQCCRLRMGEAWRQGPECEW